MFADKTTHDFPDEAIESLARYILPSIRAYFESDEGQREYAEWKAEKEKADAVKDGPEK